MDFIDIVVILVLVGLGFFFYSRARRGRESEDRLEHPTSSSSPVSSTTHPTDVQQGDSTSIADVETHGLSQKTVDEYHDFIGPNAHYYITAWQETTPKFHWPAFFLETAWLGYRRLYRKAFYFTFVVLAYQITADMFCFWVLEYPEGSPQSLARGINVGVGGWLAMHANGWYRERVDEAIRSAGTSKLAGRSWVGAVVCTFGTVFVSLVAFIGFYVILEAFGIDTPVATQVPTDIETRIVAPEIATEGEQFQIQLYVRNDAVSEQTLVEIEIENQYLQGIAIVGSDPSFSALVDYISSVGYTYDLPIPPEQEIKIILQAQGVLQGDYSGEFRVCIDDIFSCLDHRVLTTVGQ